MKKSMKPAALAASMAVLLALGACGERVETDNGLPQASGPVTGPGGGGLAAAPAMPRDDTHIDTTMMGAGPDGGEASADAQLEARVKSVLSADPDLGGLKIDVASQDGVVTLRGSAPDPAARERAGALARSLRDVKTVENQLTLG